MSPCFSSINQTRGRAGKLPGMERVKKYFAVTGSKKPYVYDLPHLLSLPPGFDFRFRYRHDWVDQRLWDDIRNRPETFVGKDLIVLFHSPERQRLLPIRQCSILSVEELGPVVHLRLRLGKFAATAFDVRALASAPESDRDAESKSQTAKARLLTGLDTHTLAETLPDGFYLRETSVDSQLTWSDDPLQGWAGLATLLQDEPAISGVPFFYLLGFTGKDSAPVPLRDVVEDRQGFSLVDGKRYQLRLLLWSWSFPKSACVRVHPQFDEDVIHAEGASDLAHSRYDVLEYSFRALHHGFTEVRLSTEAVAAAREEDGGSKTPLAWESWPAIYVARIPVRVTRNWWAVAGLAGLGVLGLLLYLIAPVIIPEGATGTVPIVQAIGLLIAFTVSSGVADKLVRTREHVVKLMDRGKTDLL